MLAGPIRRNPLRRARVTIAPMSTVSPTSVTITAPRTRLAMHWSSTDSNWSAGTATTATVTSSGTSPMVA